MAFHERHPTPFIVENLALPFSLGLRENLGAAWDARRLQIPSHIEVSLGAAPQLLPAEMALSAPFLQILFFVSLCIRVGFGNMHFWLNFRCSFR